MDCAHTSTWQLVCGAAPGHRTQSCTAAIPQAPSLACRRAQMASSRVVCRGVLEPQDAVSTMRTAELRWQGQSWCAGMGPGGRGGPAGPGPGRGGPGPNQRGGIESRQWARGTAAPAGPAGGQWTSQIPASALLHKTENRHAPHSLQEMCWVAGAGCMDIRGGRELGHEGVRRRGLCHWVAGAVSEQALGRGEGLAERHTAVNICVLCAAFFEAAGWHCACTCGSLYAKRGLFVLC